jgi:hypothetical protein
MELIGVFLGASIALLASAAYTRLAFAAAVHLPELKKAAVVASCTILVLLGVEAALLILMGAKSAFAHLHHLFTALHFAVLLLTPPAIANLILHLTAKKQTTRRFQFSAAVACCWIACITVVIAHIVIDEAIVGIDSGRPFYLSEKKPNQPLEPTTMAVTICAVAQLAPSIVVAHL